MSRHRVALSPMIVLLLSHVAAAGEGSSAVVQGNASTFETGGGRTPREVLAQGWGNLDYRVPRRLVPGGGEPRGLYASQHTPFVIRTLRPGETPLPDHQIEERVVKTLVVPRSTNPFGNELTITIDTFAGARIVRFDGHNAPPARRLTRENAGVATFDFAGSSYELNVFDDSLQVRKPRAAWQSARLALKSTVRESVQVPAGLSNVRSAMASLDDAPDVRARHERQTTPPPTAPPCTSAARRSRSRARRSATTSRRPTPARSSPAPATASSAASASSPPSGTAPPRAPRSGPARPT